MSTVNIFEFDSNLIEFSDVSFGNKGQKMVDLSLDKTSTSWSKKIIFQTCKNEKDPLTSIYGLSKVREGDMDGTKRNIELVVTDEEIIQSLKKIDEKIMKHGFENSQTFFRKALTEVEIEAKYKPILKWKEPKDVNGKGHYYIVVKVKCPGDNKPTPIKKFNENKLVGGSIDDLNYGCKVVPVVRLLFMWFMTDSFGVTPQADKFLVFPGVEKSFLDGFVLDSVFEICD